MRSTVNRALVALVVAALVAVALATTALAAPSGIPGPPPSAPGQAKKADQKAGAPLDAADAAKLKKQDLLLPAAQDLAGQARDASSDIAGVSIDVDAGVVNVYRKNPKAPLHLAGAPVDVDVHQAKFSRGEMIAASEQVTQDAKSLGDKHVAVESVGPTLDGSGLDVTVFAADQSSLDQATAVLRAKYGDIVANVHAESTKTSDANLYFNGFRFNDYAPWYGGDRINSGSAGCTDGFAATYNNAPAMLTAAHCGPVGTNWWNGPTSSGGWNFLGTTNYSNTSTDIASIGVSSTTNFINVGSDPQSPTQLYINSWASPVVGQYLCQSGSYTGERCGLYVVDTGQYVCTSWFLWWCTSSMGPLADVISAYGSGSPAAGHGDSGGPVYRYVYVNGSWQGVAEGLVHGQLTPNAQSLYPAYFPDTLSCPAPEGWSNRCSSGFSFAHMPGY